ncbi:MAG: FG-GAP-like repeat-containing protein [Thermoanaerobaculia bacterium]
MRPFVLVAILVFSQTTNAAGEDARRPIPLQVSEFRLRGPGGAADEYIELHNTNPKDHIVRSRDATAGYAIVTADGKAHAFVPNGVRIPAYGHLLLAGSAYSLPVKADVRYELEIADNTAFALFASTDPRNFNRTFRIDATAPGSEASALYRKITYRDVPETDAEQALVRIEGDFRFVAASAPSMGVVARLGSPNPSNLSSPIESGGTVAIVLADPTASPDSAPNMVVDRSARGINADKGLVTFRRRVRNNSARPITSLRLRLIDLSTYPGAPDLRLLDSPTLRVASGNLPFGGGLNAVANVSAVSDLSPLDPGQTRKIELRFGIVRDGVMHWSAVAESLPGGPPGPAFKSAAHIDVRAQEPIPIVWRNRRTGSTSLWLMNGAQARGYALPSPGDRDWQMEGAADFAGMCESNLLWRNTRTGVNVLWRMEEGRVAGSQVLPAMSEDWTVAGIGDFQGDGRADILWRRSNGSNRLWMMDADRKPVPADLPDVDAAWQVAATGDFQDDGKTDIFWRNPLTGDNSMWLMDGPNVSATFAFPSVPAPWFVAGCGDLQGDGLDDLIWRNPATGGDSVWFMNGSTMVGRALPSLAGRSWIVAAVSDFQRDGNSDIFWRNIETGVNLLWLMSGSATFGVETTPVPPEWDVMPRKKSLDVSERP